MHGTYITMIFHVCVIGFAAVFVGSSEYINLTCVFTSR